MKTKTIRKILIWILAILILLSGILFAVGYFYYAKIIQNYLTETVKRESKGLYTLEIGSLSLNILSGNVTIDKFSLVPDTAFYKIHSHTDTLSPLLFKVILDKFRIKGFRVMDAVRNRRIDVSRILFSNPEVTVYRMKIPPKKNEDKHKEKMMSIPLPKGLTSIEIGEFLVENAKLDFIDCSKDSVTVNSFPTCNILIKHILVDSTHQGKIRLFNADDIRITLGSYSMIMKNGMNKISFGEIGLSTAARELYIKDFHLEPLYNKFDYTRKLGFQTDWMDIRISNLVLRRMNLRSLLFEGKIKVGLLEIDTLNLEDYRDKRIPRKPGFKPPMPQDGIRNLKTYLRIDSVLLKGGKAIYSEQVKDTAGTIFFDQLSATFTGLTNDSLLLKAGLVSELKGTAYMMGKGKLDATIRFNFGDKKNSFTFSAMMGPVDLAEINPLLTKLLPAKVESGKIKKLLIPQVYANDDFAQGKLLFYYNDLSVSVIDKKQTTWTKIKTGVVTWAANDLVVNNDNPTKSGKMHTGVVYFKRDKEKGIINFLWKSTLSGLKSTMGFNSKAQKELIKEEKQKAEIKEKKEKKPKK